MLGVVLVLARARRATVGPRTTGRAANAGTDRVPSSRRRTMGRRLATSCLMLLLAGAAAWLCVARVQAQSNSGHVIEVRRIVPPDGHAIFDAYCAACHGDSGRVTDAKLRPRGAHVPDLTRVTVRDGKFDLLHVISHVECGPGRTMPDWQALLQETYRSPGAEDLVVNNLALYVKSLQVEP
jgi:mono/diheme cytochrome c family protein